MQNTFDKIIDDYLEDFGTKQNLPYVVKNSIPIIWFGDIYKYLTSPQKVITVAINPSFSEFSEERFPAALNVFNKNNLYESLNDYFNYNPYKKWFQRYESVINCVGATYGGKVSKLNGTNYALNVDLLSSIATNPTWGKLTVQQKKQIANTSLFWELYRFLDPDIIFISLDRKVTEFQFKLSAKQKITSTSTDGQIEIYKDGKRSIVFGRNMCGTVFGGLGMSINFISKTIKESGI